MPAYYLEIIVVVLGLTMLMVDTFVPLRDKRSLGWLAILGLLVVFVLNFTVARDGGGDTPFASFYVMEWSEGYVM